MSHRFTLVSVALTAVVSFLVGAIFAGGGSQPSVEAGARPVPSVLLEVNRQRVDSVSEFRRLVRAARPGDILALSLDVPDVDQHQVKTVQMDGR